mgnify:CR=1 FL=1
MPMYGSAVVVVLRVSHLFTQYLPRACTCLDMADLPDLAGLHSTRGELNACAVLIVG